MHEIPWAVLKDRISKKGLAHQLTDLGDRYFVFIVEDGVPFFSIVFKSIGDEAAADIAANYLSTANQPLVPKNPDGRIIQHTTPRKRGTYTQFTGAGDAQTNESVVAGAGTRMTMHHQVAGGAISPIYIDFNTIINESHAHAGVMMWKDALNDVVTLETVPKTTGYTSGSNTYYNLYGGYLIIPAAGDGVISLTETPKLVEVPLNEFGVRAGAGYWDATYNSTTHQFENIAANLTGTGRFNIFASEIKLDRFMNQTPMLGSGQIEMDTYDASQIGHNMRIKLTFETVGADHEWWWCGFLKPFRKRTV